MYGVYSSCLTMRAYFSIFEDVAGIWVTSSARNIMPGVKLCDGLSQSANENEPTALRSKAKKLESWSKDASACTARVAKYVSTVRNTGDVSLS